MSSPLVGIDFGNLTSRIAFLDGRGILEPGFIQTVSIPGEIPFAKRFLGKSGGSFFPLAHEGVNSAEKIRIHFTQLKSSARELAGKEAASVVFSAPCCLKEDERRALEEASVSAGFKPLSWIYDSTAAFLAWQILAQKEGIFALLNCGAGFLEIAVANLEAHSLTILSRRGFAWGGRDIDIEIAGRLVPEANIVFETDLTKRPEWVHFLKEVERARISLARRGSYDFEFLLAGQNGVFSRALSRYEYQSWMAGELERVAGLCREVLEESRSGREVTGILLAGAASRGVFLREAVKNIFRKDFCPELDCEFAVVYGAALQAGILSGEIPHISIKDPE